MAEERPLDQISSEELYKGAMAPDPTPATPVPPEAPAEPLTPAPETPAVQEPPAAPPPQPQPEHIPSWRLREEAEARRAAEDRARMLEERLQQIATHMQQQQKQPDFFENPDQATQALILRTIGPYAEEQRKQMMYMGKMVASAVHGADKVDEAEEAFLKARDAQTLDPVDYERVVQAPNRYDAVVKWHRTHNVLSSVGDDPVAWFNKTLEAQLADPKFQASLLQRINGGAAQRPGTVNLPPSLSRVTAAASNASESLGDMSDQSLWAAATHGMPHKR